jgi:dihydrofolate reductase
MASRHRHRIGSRSASRKFRLLRHCLGKTRVATWGESHVAQHAVDWNARLVTSDAVTEITRLNTEDGGPMDVGGATLAAAAMRAGLIDEYAIVTHPVLLGGGTPFFTALDNWVNLNLVETRTFPDGVLLTRYETRR